MTHLQFDQLAIQGFKTFRHAQMIDFTAYESGLHFIRGVNKYKPRMGPNGVGKSAVWDALLWCLYGFTVRGLRNPDIKPWKGLTDPTAVTLWLTIGKDKHVINRTASPNRLMLDDGPVGQDKIDSLIGIPKEVFCHTILLGQGEALFLDLKPKDKMDVFNSVLQLDKWEDRAKAASKKASALTESAQKTSGTIDGLNSGIEQITAVIDDARKKAAQWTKDQGVDEAQQNKELAALMKTRAAKQRLVDDADLAYDSAATEVRAVEKKTNDLENQIIRTSRSLKTMQLEVDSVIRERVKLVKSRDDLKADKKCPTCGQTMRNINHLKKHVAELEKEIVKLASQRKALVQTETDHAVLLNGFEKKLDQQRTFLKDFTAKAEAAEATLSFQKNDISDINVKISVIEKLLQRAQNTMNPHLEQIKTLKRKRDTMKGEVEELTELHKKLLRRVERTKFWAKGFKDVQLYIVEEVLQELELVSNTLLTEMGLDEWEIKYAIEKETKAGTIQRGLSVTVLSPDNDQPVRWECWSGGEGQRLRVLGALALSEVLLNHAGVTTNLEILDEPTRGLSDEGVDDLCRYLALRASQLNKQCWLIDHAAIPSTQFTSTLTVVRDKKGSRFQVHV